MDYFRNACHVRNREAVYAVFLDSKNRVIELKQVCEGTLTQSLLYPREIITECMKRGALSFIIIHNHPSGDPTPSENDRKITRKLLFATKEMDIAMLDHIIVGTEGKGYYSFYEDGLMAHYNGNYRMLTENMDM